MKSGYFPSAFNKNQHWSLTHRLNTASAGHRGRDFSGGTGWHCSPIGNRTLETKKGRGTAEGRGGGGNKCPVNAQQGLQGWHSPKTAQIQERGSRGLGSPAAGRPLSLASQPSAPQGCSSQLCEDSRVFSRCPVTLSRGCSPHGQGMVAQS